MSDDFEAVPDEEVEELSQSQPEHQSESDSFPSQSTSEYDPMMDSESSCWSDESQVYYKKRHNCSVEVWLLIITMSMTFSPATVSRTQ